MLQAWDVHAVLGNAGALQGVSMAVGPGEVVAVAGAGGAGKSTLLHVLSGSLPPRSGRVCLDCYPLATWPPRALARRRAVLPQRQELSFTFDALEVALLGRSPHLGASSPREDLEAARACLAETGAAHLAERVYTTLSEGERQQVQLARALAQVRFTEAEGGLAGRYLLLDEPGSRLDPARRRAALDAVRRAAALGAGAVVALRDMDLAAMYGDRVVVLAEGRVLAEGPPRAGMDRGDGAPVLRLRYATLRTNVDRGVT